LDRAAKVKPYAKEALRERVRNSLFQSADLKKQTADVCADAIVAGADLIATAFAAGNKLLLCGNGGSAADCQHLAAEFVSRFRREVDRRALPAIALTTDSSFLTAFANDIGYDGVFERQVEALGLPGDVLIGISTSGSSKNVVLAIELAKARGLRTIALTGSGGVLRGMVDVGIAVPSRDTQHIQETHLAIEHALCDLVEATLFGDLVKPA